MSLSWNISIQNSRPIMYPYIHFDKKSVQEIFYLHTFLYNRVIIINRKAFWYTLPLFQWNNTILNMLFIDQTYSHFNISRNVQIIKVNIFYSFILLIFDFHFDDVVTLCWLYFPFSTLKLEILSRVFSSSSPWYELYTNLRSHRNILIRL